MSRPSATFTSLQDLLDKEGFDSPYAFGRSLYKWVDCGPWTSFITPGIVGGSFNRHSVYYESAETRGWAVSRWAAHCTGIKIGSIVEGSDAEVGPVELLFPFTREDLWSAIENINDEACAIWDESNAADAEETVE